MKNFTALVTEINEIHQWFSQQVARQVNTALTLRNWIFGMYLFEYEQHGQDRAQYGEKLYREVASRLTGLGLKGVSDRMLYWCKNLYLCYPEISKTLSSKFQKTDNQAFRSILTLAESFNETSQVEKKELRTDPELLVNSLSFSHFIELLKADTLLKRTFYETQAIAGCWSVRELQRAMNSMLFERTGLSTDKQAMLDKYRNGAGLKPEDILRSPYVLEFLGIEEKPAYNESDLETAIIDHLQHFLMEMGRGFCFEARQKRITFGNKHYRIDLVFYHRILKCHVLFDLKIGEFDHADAGQMNVYLNYFKDVELTEGDHPPVGVILCADKNETLVKYATGGLEKQVFVSKYLINLPTEDELKSIIQEEQIRLGQTSGIATV